MKLTILFFLMSIEVTAQKLIFVPDINLRKELYKQGFITNDSLDIRKTQGRLQLELNNKEIENTYGLQYFDQVWRLIINNNKIKRLDNLPPHLTVLECSNNEMIGIDNLPPNLKHFGCSNNHISKIENLPPYLISLNFSDNFMNYMPPLPKTIQYINYFNNPISSDSLPTLFQNIKCDYQLQNCLPYELINWKILNANIKDTLFKITGMKIILNSHYSWGFGSQVETINFKIKKSKLVANQINVRRKYDKNIQSNKIDSCFHNNINYSVAIAEINQFLNDIYSNKLVVQIPIGDSLKSIDLTRKKNGETCFSSCEDCSS